MFAFPRLEDVWRTKRWNHGTHAPPDCRFCPNKSGAARPKQPFVGTGRECVAANNGDLRIFHAEAVHAIDDQEHTILFIASAIYIGERLGDARDRESHAAA